MIYLYIDQNDKFFRIFVSYILREYHIESQLLYNESWQKYESCHVYELLHPVFCSHCRLFICTQSFQIYNLVY